GEDWEAEYEGMSEGDPMYLHKLVEYLTYFSGRFAIGVDAQGPTVPDRERAMSVFRRGLGLSDEAGDGDQVRLTPEGLEPIDGVRPARPRPSSRRTPAEAACPSRLGAPVPEDGSVGFRHRGRADPDVRDGGRHPGIDDPDEGGRAVRTVRAGDGQVRDVRP